MFHPVQLCICRDLGSNETHETRVMNFSHDSFTSILIHIDWCRCDLKITYHGFLKMTVHVVWNIALRE